MRGAQSLLSCRNTDSKIFMLRLSSISYCQDSLSSTTIYVRPQLNRKKKAHFKQLSYLSSSLSFWQFPIKFPNWHEWICSWIWRRNASLNSKACGNCSVKCHTHSKNWVNTGETSFGSPSKWPHLPPRKYKLLKMPLEEVNCLGTVKFKYISPHPEKKKVLKHCYIGIKKNPHTCHVSIETIYEFFSHSFKGSITF